MTRRAGAGAFLRVRLGHLEEEQGRPFGSAVRVRPDVGPPATKSESDPKRTFVPHRPWPDQGIKSREQGISGTEQRPGFVRPLQPPDAKNCDHTAKLKWLRRLHFRGRSVGARPLTMLRT